ncbi:MAG: hypothetical protein K2X27_03100, partial [Candidatus Obscuribacterales bacterium]|nr:hypothetical protein [Candidatus Obscuribacterales bacterium]
MNFNLQLEKNDVSVQNSPEIEDSRLALVNLYSSLALRHFDKLDLSQNGRIDRDELNKASEASNLPDVAIGAAAFFNENYGKFSSNGAEESGYLSYGYSKTDLRSLKAVSSEDKYDSYRLLKNEGSQRVGLVGLGMTALGLAFAGSACYAGRYGVAAAMGAPLLLV